MTYRLSWIVGAVALAPTDALMLTLAPAGEATPRREVFINAPSEQFRMAIREAVGTHACRSVPSLLGRRVAVKPGEYVLGPPPLEGRRPVLAVAWPERETWPPRALVRLARRAGLADVGQLVHTFEVVHLADHPVVAAELGERALELRGRLGDIVVAPELPAGRLATALAVAVWRARGVDHDAAVHRAAGGDPSAWRELAARGVVAMPATPALGWRAESRGFPERWSRPFANGVLGLVYGPPWTSQLGDAEFTAVCRDQALDHVELAACLAGLRDPAAAGRFANA